MKSKRLSRRGTKFTCTNKASSTMPPRRGKKPATEPDLDALLLSLTGPGAGAPKKRSKRKQKSKKDLSPSPEPSLELRSVDGDVQQAVAKPKTRRKARQAVQVKDQTLATAIGKKRCAGRSKPKSKVALRRHDTQAALQDEDDEEKEYMGARSPSDCENDLPSFSSRDHDADDFIVVMKRMADERKKQRERDERRINAFFLSKMQKTQISAEQRVLAISAEASERTKAFVTDVSAQGKEILSAAKTIAKEDSVGDMHHPQALLSSSGELNNSTTLIRFS